MLICPKCGKTSDKVAFIEAFCVDCYPTNVQEPKKKIFIKACKRCNKMFLKGEWLPLDYKKISEYVVSKCRGEFSEAGYDFDRQVVIFTIRKRDSEVKVERKAHVEIEWMMCRNCSRMSGGYFEAIVQLRGEEKRVERYKKLFETKLAKKTFIAKEKEQKTGGVDLFIGSSKAVFELMHELGLRAKITRKLVGRKEGKRFFRITYSIRL
jgi:nonsense-mediated mRNA decay protein 3